MKKIGAILSIALSFAFAGVVFAEAGLTSMQLKAASFLLKKSEQQAQAQSQWHDACHDQPVNDGRCVQFVAGSYPTTDERLRAARACAGVTNIECVQFAAGSYPTFSEREAAARSCSGVTDSECVQFVAGSYPTTAERAQAANACRYASVECVRQVAGSYPTFAERVAAAKACGGQ